MDVFWISIGLVAGAEIGGKTQLLTLVLAARFRQLAPIIVDIFVATIVNHALAGALGACARVFAGTTPGMMIANVPVTLVGNRQPQRGQVRCQEVVVHL